MDYIREFINPFVRLKTFGDGLIMVKTKLRLGIASLDVGQVLSQDIDQDKKSGTAISSKDNAGSIKAEEFEAKMAEQMNIRKATDSVTLGTLYGKAQRFVLDLVQHSVSGINVGGVTTDGVPSVSAILKRLREVAVSVEIKEQRNGRFFNAILDNGFYDNATSLLVVMKQKIALFNMLERTKRHRAQIRIPIYLVEGIVNERDPNKAISLLVDAIRHGKHGLGTSTRDRYLHVILDNIKLWYRSVPPKEKMSQSGANIINPEYSSAVFTHEAEVWHMYDYDDGHSKSGRNFGSHLDFVNNKYLVPQWCFTIENGLALNVDFLKQEVPANDLAIDQLAKKRGYMNLAGFSNDETLALLWCLKGNMRSTPFLIDQDIDFEIPELSYVAYHVKPPVEKTYHITAQLLTSAMHKFVNNHRVYEDYLSASRVLKYWYVQPATETVESHWWTAIDRELHLPQLGLKRAAIPLLLESDGICVTTDALNHYRELTKANDACYIESLFVNACWYWGEYMLLFNNKNCSDLIKKMHYHSLPDIHPFARSDAILSAMIGKAVPRPMHKDVCTLITGGIESQLRTRVRFGKIAINHIEEYNYIVEDDDIIFDNIVTPGALGLITGLGGSLIRSTPYASMFSTNMAVTKQEYGITRKGLNYNDLWAIGVISRWNGYDLDYIHPARSGRHTIYAANDVSVAVPPVAPLNLPAPSSYVVSSYRMRKRVFGFSPEMLSHFQVTAYWSRGTTNAQEGPNYLDLPCGFADIHTTLVRSIKLEPVKFDNYVAAVVGEYDIHHSDFRLDVIEAGVPMPSNIPQLSSEAPQQLEETGRLELAEPPT